MTNQSFRYRPLLWVLACIFSVAGAVVHAKEEARICPMGREYYLYTPDKIDKGRTYWLVVGVHGLGGSGKGAEGWDRLTKHGDCIVVGPTFPRGYQFLESGTDKQLLGIAAQLNKEFNLRPRLFIVGFSAGAQYAHRFALAYPGLVAGCAAHSAGSWATGGRYGNINRMAAKVPFAISCGENDTEKSTVDSPTGRLVWCKGFETTLRQGGSYFKAQYWPGVGHNWSDGARKLTEECYFLVTHGMHSKEYAEVQKQLDEIEALIQDRRFREAFSRLRPAPAKDKGTSRFKPTQQSPAAMDPYGWNLNSAAQQTLNETAMSNAKKRMDDFMTRVESGVLEEIARSEAEGSPDVIERLQAMRKDYPGVKKIAAAVTRAIANQKKAPRPTAKSSAAGDK